MHSREQLWDAVLYWSLKKLPGLTYLEQKSITKSWPFSNTNLSLAIVFPTALTNKRTKSFTIHLGHCLELKRHSVIMQGQRSKPGCQHKQRHFIYCAIHNKCKPQNIYKAGLVAMNCIFPIMIQIASREHKLNYSL